MGKLRKRDSYTLFPVKCPVRDKASNLKTEDLIMCCVPRAVAHLREGCQVNKEQWWDDD
jgi:hypothetical protein